MRRLVLAAIVAVLATEAHAVSVLMVGKTAVFRNRSGKASALVALGRDPAFGKLADPTCAGGATMRLQVGAYPVATFRVDAQDPVDLPCTGWKKRGDGFVFQDASGTAGGVRKVIYSHARFLARIEGGTYRHIPAPVGYA